MGKDFGGDVSGGDLERTWWCWSGCCGGAAGGRRVARQEASIAAACGLGFQPDHLATVQGCAAGDDVRQDPQKVAHQQADSGAWLESAGVKSARR